MSIDAQHVLLLGATGMVGGHALDFLLDDPRVARVTVLGRRPVERQHDKLHQVVHPDLLHLAPVAAHLAGVHAVVFCVGAYTGALSNDIFEQVTVDMPIAVGKAVLEQNAEAVFCLLSGMGADRTERSRTAFARFKGKAENGLSKLGFSRFHTFRPGYIYPVTPRNEPNFSYTVMRVLYPVVRAVYPNIGIPAPDLARAIVEGALAGTPRNAEVIENADIRAFAASLPG